MTRTANTRRLRRHPLQPGLLVGAAVFSLAAATIGHAQTELPAGHPPVSAAPAAAQAVPPVAPDAGRGAQGLVWDVPEGWIAETPSSSMRRAQYRVPAPPGAEDPNATAECIVFYFGPNQGGDATANVERWGHQFTRPDGSSAKPDLVTRTLDVDGLEVLIAEVAGTYDGGMRMRPGAHQSYPDYRLLGAIAAGPDANWFFKMVGPDATVAAQRQAFEAMIRSLRVGGG